MTLWLLACSVRGLKRELQSFLVCTSQSSPLSPSIQFNSIAFAHVRDGFNKLVLLKFLSFLSLNQDSTVQDLLILYRRHIAIFIYFLGLSGYGILDDFAYCVFQGNGIHSMLLTACRNRNSSVLAYPYIHTIQQSRFKNRVKKETPKG